MLNLLQKTVATVAVCLAFLSIAAPSHGQALPTVDYDTFMKQDLQGRIRTFNLISAENRAELIRTQIARWVDSRRNSLTSEQLKMTEEWLAMVTPDLYRPERSETLMARVKDVQTRSATLFSSDDLRQALTNRGEYIPKK